MDTLLLGDTTEDVEIASEILVSGGLVAFPTETVYGLGADALNPDAVGKVYTAKGRPSDNPMIVHVAPNSDLLKLTPKVTGDMAILMKKFWPGPMTMVVPGKKIIPKVTTGGLNTVGLRMPSNPVAMALIQKSGCFIAAPSANLSGKPSPTTADHVVKDLKGKVDAIIQSGPCMVGIESTVIDMTEDVPMILRPGIITKAQIEEALGKTIKMDPTLNQRPDMFNNETFHPKAPGMKYKHYAPKAQMIIFEGDEQAAEAALNREKHLQEEQGKKVYVILFGEGEQTKAAHDFFAQLRQADDEGADLILARALPEEGVGFSVMNRMLKSAGYNIREV